MHTGENMDIALMQMTWMILDLGTDVGK